MKSKNVCIVGLVVLFSCSVFAAEPVHWDAVDKIMDEAFENSDVMENASWLTDVYSPRSAKSPAYIAAAKWSRDKLKEYGLSNAKLDPYKFDVGFVNEYISVHMRTPKYMPIIAYPATWSSGTDGRVRGKAIYINFDEIRSEEQLEQYRGKLKDTVILTRPKQKITPQLTAPATRYTKEQLDEMAKIKVGPRPKRERRERDRDDRGFSKDDVIKFVFEEGCIACGTILLGCGVRT